MSLKNYQNKGIEMNELNKNSMGGTEISRIALNTKLPADLKNAFQIISSRVRDLDPNRPRIYWLHDLAEDPEVQHLRDPKSRKRFKKLVFVSHWQFSNYHKILKVPYSESIVIRNAIDPILSHQKSMDYPIRIIYHTTPHRGLDILISVYKELSKKWGNKLHLDVYSSFKIYGWDHRDEPFEQIFHQCEEHPYITYHGCVSNDKIRKALQKAHIFAYPSTWQETSSLAVIEAMSAGCCIVCSSLGALPETTSNFAVMYPFHEKKERHANIFFNVLDLSIKKIWEDNVQKMLSFQKQYTDTFYSWNIRIKEWEILLRSLLKK